MERLVLINTLKFINNFADEVLYTGESNERNTFVQLADAILFAERYPNSRQLIFEKNFESVKNTVSWLIEICQLIQSKWDANSQRLFLNNGSIIELGWLDDESEYMRYGSIEVDVMRFNGMPISEHTYLFMKSKVRGGNVYPKQIKTTTNANENKESFLNSRFLDASGNIKKHFLGKSPFNEDVYETRCCIQE